MSKKEEELQISSESYEQSEIETDDAIVYSRFYHYLAHLNHLTPLSETELGAIVAPRKMMKGMGFGFAKNDQVFCVHLTGLLKDYFERFTPIHCILSEDDDEQQGITFMMKPLKFGDYNFPPVILFLPIISPRVFRRVKNNSDRVCFTEIERSIIDPNGYEVKNVLDGYVKISSRSDYTAKDKNEKMMRMF